MKINKKHFLTSILFLDLLYLATGSAFFGIPLIFIFWAFPLTIFLSDSKSLIKNIFLSSAISILLLYPLTWLIILIEGQSGLAIFQSHKELEMILIVSLNLFFSLFTFKKFKDHFEIDLNKSNIFYISLFALTAFLLFLKLNRADLAVDEIDLGYRAYDLVDGMLAGRKAFLLSFYDHTPLALIANGFSMQVLNNSGFENLQDWMIRFANAFVILLSYGTWTLVFQKHLKKDHAKIAALLLAVSVPFLFSGKIFLREGFITFYLGIFFLFIENWKVATLALGSILLTKSVDFPIVLFGLFLIPKKEIKKSILWIFIMVIPILIYNIGAYLETGYMDILSSKIFGINNPAGYTGSRAHAGTISEDLKTIFLSLADQITIPALGLLILGAALSIKDKKLNKFTILLVLMLLYYSLVGVRAYYLVYMAHIYAILISFPLSKIKSSYLKISFTALLFIYLSFYSYKTFYDSSYTQEANWNDSGRSGMISPELNLLQDHSYTLRAWSESRGWKDLKGNIAAFNINDPVLVLDKNLDELHLRQYLNIMQTVKKFYLGENYQETYKYFIEGEEPIGGDLIKINLDLSLTKI